MNILLILILWRTLIEALTGHDEETWLYHDISPPPCSIFQSSPTRVPCCGLGLLRSLQHSCQDDLSEKHESDHVTSLPKTFLRLHTFHLMKTQPLVFNDLTPTLFRNPALPGPARQTSPQLWI